MLAIDGSRAVPASQEQSPTALVSAWLCTTRGRHQRPDLCRSCARSARERMWPAWRPRDSRNTGHHERQQRTRKRSFGYAALKGVDALLQVPVLAHQCDNPLCQNPRCWRESNHRANSREYAYRRDVVRGALTDTRGARGRARAVRDAARAGVEISQAVLAGIRPVHLDQIALFPDLDDGG